MTPFSAHSSQKPVIINFFIVNTGIIRLAQVKEVKNI